MRVRGYCVLPEREAWNEQELEPEQDGNGTCDYEVRRELHVFLRVADVIGQGDLTSQVTGARPVDRKVTRQERSFGLELHDVRWVRLVDHRRFDAAQELWGDIPVVPVVGD